MQTLKGPSLHLAQFAAADHRHQHGARQRRLRFVKGAQRMLENMIFEIDDATDPGDVQPPRGRPLPTRLHLRRRDRQEPGLRHGNAEQVPRRHEIGLVHEHQRIPGEQRADEPAHPPGKAAQQRGQQQLRQRRAALHPGADARQRGDQVERMAVPEQQPRRRIGAQAGKDRPGRHRLEDRDRIARNRKRAVIGIFRQAREPGIAMPRHIAIGIVDQGNVGEPGAGQRLPHPQEQQRNATDAVIGKAEIEARTLSHDRDRAPVPARYRRSRRAGYIAARCRCCARSAPDPAWCAAGHGVPDRCRGNRAPCAPAHHSRA